jgi:mono/diheme cytochrome c family protein
MTVRQRLGASVQAIRTYPRRYRHRHLPILLLVLVVLVLVVFLVSGIGGHYWDVRDNDPDRGATTVGHDVFGDSYTSVRYLGQNWNESQSLWFYNTTQGSDFLPYDFFLALEQPGSTELIRSNENINNRYRYLPRKPTAANPDGLPVGFVKDEYGGKEYFGFTCAACHTSQLNYKGVGYRIDGGPAGADLDKLIADVRQSLDIVRDSTTPAHARFVANVLRLGNYRSEREIMEDVERYRRRVRLYAAINHPKAYKQPRVEYGYARLDAFGRIYNRVLEHVMDTVALREALNGLALDTMITEAQLKTIINAQAAKTVFSAEDRDRLLALLDSVLSVKQQVALRNQIFNPPTAPVSYPFLWDIPQHDFVQWNGLASNAGLGPVGRNAGEVIGVFATLDWSAKRWWSISSLIGGQGFKATHISYKSSVNVANLRSIERQLTKLQSPMWGDTNALLPPIDRSRAERGERLFDRHCAACHAEIVRDDPHRRVVAHISGLEKIGTDTMMAANAAHYMGRSGILRNQYIKTSVGDLLLDARAPVAELLTKVTTGVVATPDPDHWWPRRGYDWIRELAVAFFSNEIQPSIRRGAYVPDNTVDPFASLAAYKARSLNGIWATAPYLHNGSVPTLYDLLLPQRPPGDTSSGPFRPDTFRVGSREFDPEWVGFRSTGYDGFLFKTRLAGNSNAGHIYPPPCPPAAAVPAPTASGTRSKASVKPGRVPAADLETAPDTEPEPMLPPNDPMRLCGPLTHEERLDLIEYLKTL